MNDKHDLLQYEEKLTEILVRQCTSKGWLDGHLLEIGELDEKWAEIAPEYMADAVPEFNQYPAAAIAWAAYVGMGIGSIWDGAWDEYKNKTDLYQLFRVSRGFDAMDEYVVEELLGVDSDSKENKSIKELWLGCAHTAMTIIRKEKIEPQTAQAFYLFASTTKIFFRLGIAVELRLLGYKNKS
ncbi:MAG: hypothetical protein RR034_07515 [Bacteroidales bacterium]